MEPKPPEQKHDLDNIRATLCLLFPEAVASRLAALAEHDKPDTRLARLVGRVTVQLRLNRLRRLRKPGQQDVEAAPPLGPTSGVSNSQALALALHLGLDLPATELAELLHRSVEEIGEQLYLAREALSPRPVSSCPEFIPVLGRYGDPSLEINQRVTLLRHTAGCGDCGKSLEAFQQIDKGLRRYIHEAASKASSTQPKPTLWDRLLTSSKVWLSAAILLALVIVLFAGIGVSRLVGNREQSVPLLRSAAAGVNPTGWLLTVDPGNGALQAIDLASGQSRDVGAGNGSAGSSYVLAALSPNRQLIANWGPMYSATGPASQVPLVVERLDGSGVFQHVWPLPNAPTLAGWLDTTHVLMLSTEQIGDPSRNRYTSSIISIDVTDGDMRTLTTTTGASTIDDVAASPDGTLVAISYSDAANQSHVELTAVLGNALGPTVAMVRDVASGLRQNALVWSPNSRHLYLSRIDDMNAPVLQSNTASALHWSHRSIIAVDRSGKVTTVVSPAGTYLAAIPIIVMPGSQRLVYEIEDLSKLRSGVITSSIWGSGPVPDQGSQSQRLLENVMPLTASAFASPGINNQILLEVVEPGYLTGGAESRSANDKIEWPVVYSVDSDGATTPILTSPALTSSALIGWISADALPDASSTGSLPPFDLDQTSHASIPDFDGAVDASSIVSPDCKVVVTRDPMAGRGGLLRLDRVSGESESWSQDLRDPAWFGSSGDVLIAATLPDTNLPSRLQWLATTGSRIGQGYDGLAADPANIGDTRSLAYASPAVSANGLATSFFVIDQRAKQAQLWIAALHHQPRKVDSWAFGSKQAGDLPLLATWVNDTTLVYIVPGSWKDGLPQSPTLVRLTIEPDGSTQQQTLITFHRSGFDRGLAVAGLALAPGQTTLAIRIRHFSHNDASSGVTDAIQLMPTSNLRQQLEVDRAAIGSGLTWSPDGRWLAFGLKGDIGVVAATGTPMHYVDASGSAGAPLWIGRDEIWFTTNRDGKNTNQRIIFP